MSIQVDFIIAVGLFFVVFLVVVSATGSYFSVSFEEAHVNELRSDAEFLLDMLCSKQSDLSITGETTKIDVTILSNGTEISWPPRFIDVIEQSKVNVLKSMDYMSVKDLYILNNFHITLTGVLEFGPVVPEEGNVVSLYRPVLYQGGSKSGNLIVYMW